MGKLAVKRLMRLINHEEIEYSKIIVMPELIIRESTTKKTLILLKYNVDNYLKGVQMTDINLELVGEEKDKAVNRAKEMVSSWGLKLPDVYVCPFHFGINDFYRIGDLEFDINNNIKEGYCGKLIFMFKNQTCPYHYHKIKHETFYIIKGKIEMTAEGKKTILNIGDIFVMDQNIKHSFIGIEDSLILESSKPDVIDDSIFEDENINMKILQSTYQTTF